MMTDNIMKFGLQHPVFGFDYRNLDTSQIVDSLKNLVTRAENRGFDSFWVMEPFPPDSICRKARRTYA